MLGPKLNFHQTENRALKIGRNKILNFLESNNFYRIVIDAVMVTGVTEAIVPPNRKITKILTTASQFIRGPRGRG